MNRKTTYKSQGNKKHPYKILEKIQSYTVCTDTDSVQKARAAQLEALGLFDYASQVKKCGTIQFYRGKPEPMRCHHRLCPQCADRLVQHNTRRVVNGVRRFQKPVIYIASLRSKSLYDLKETVDNFLYYHKLFRRRKNFKEGILSGIGALEVKLAKKKMVWNVHAHFVLDLTPRIRELWLHEAWWELTEGRGSFLPHDESDVDLRNLKALAKYITKNLTWCPTPGKLGSTMEEELELLEQIHDALKDRKLLIAWGAAYRVKEQDNDIVDAPTLDRHRLRRSVKLRRRRKSSKPKKDCISCQ